MNINKFEKMTPYYNSRSGVRGYEIGEDFIRVRFSTGRTYRYTYRSAGEQHIENMKRLAVQGSGLNSYINRFVKYAYA